MLGKEFVKVFGGDKLKDRVTEEFQSLVGAQRQIVEADAAVGERPGQQPDVHELRPDRILKFGHLMIIMSR